ncbi:semaphorin-3A-like [Thunnus maccoyii]|uniref:semaphorin-3A-like n=1 Tax=Thunnus maccoyii TaxID=8240 RepID=UPI001C4DC9A3|nr:semaphorin-3A-like [Thunnus maccoyii]XP_042259959.1 semaphorin-3A-like [Thunnus maccoyii]XP_042259960.1 semaphorin-3A-like [Thunnus maccoyii]XP_042259961.1 semaphorin-3A-like [Thunnus maccoyii]XP_042259962.1 semaphorin-3A-like [Thunnus maccoyii]
MDYLFGIVVLLCGAVQPGRGVEPKHNVPRLKLSYKEMLESSNLVTFNGLANSSSYDAFLLDEERGRLLVGAEDHIFSFDLVNINRDHKQIAWPATPSKRDECKWAGKDLGKECSNFIRVLQPYNQTHLYICGTGAFHPICAFLEMGKRAEENIFRLASHFENGRGKSPYDPKMLSASLLIDGELYSGTSADFMGRDFAIFRTLGDHHPIRTEQHDSRWLNDPRFISVHLIPESDNPEDDKIFLFFKENAMDGEHTGKATIARIGQLCKNDMGGHRSLVNKWTTFLKARLMCSVPGVNGIDTHFDELQDVFLMNSKDPKNPVIYAVFTTSSNIFKGSAVCMYNMADIRRVFLGPYAHRDGPNYQWVPFQGRVPYPRPGTCPSKTFGGFDSTKDLPDDVITFARGHPAMYNPVHPIGGRPIMVRTDVDYQFSQLVVDRVEAEDGQYDVMFIGTDMGTVLKVVTIPRESWHDLEEVVLEEMTVFREPTPITAMELSTKQQQLYLGSALGVSQMSLHRCEVYGKACAECCLARDPYCAWDGSECSRYFPTAKRRTRRQDIRNGDPLSQCSDLQHHDDMDGLGASVEDRSVYGVENSSMFLECSPKSQRALIYWQLQKPNDDRKHEIKLDDRVLRTEQGLLIRSLTQTDTGVYHCQAVEHGFIQPLLRLNLQVIPAQKLGDILPGLPGVGSGAGHSAKHRLWYRDFLSLLDHPDLNSVEEFCDRVWKKERKQKRVKTPNNNGQGKPDSTGVPHSALQPKALAPNAQKQQASPPQSRQWLQAGAPTVEGPARSQTTQRGQQNMGMLSGQAPKNNQKTQNGQKGQGSLAGSQVAGGSRAGSQHTAKWRRMQENKKGRNRRTHELQRPPRSV